MLIQSLPVQTNEATVFEFILNFPVVMNLMKVYEMSHNFVKYVRNVHNSLVTYFFISAAPLLSKLMVRCTPSVR
jgi:hypothetical protein